MSNIPIRGVTRHGSIQIPESELESESTPFQAF